MRITNRPLTGSGTEMSWESPQCCHMESETTGEYYEKGDSRYCLYEEQPEGWEEPHTVMLKWKGTVLERHIRRNPTSRMVFEAGKRRRDFYRTPYGDLLLETETHRLEIREEQGEIFLALEYDIRQEEQRISENRMEIHIKEIR